MSCEDYFEDIRRLRRSDSDLVEVAHEPMSERYFRAQQYLDILLTNGECIGCYEELREHGYKYVEVITWIEPENGKFSRYEDGSYAAYKLFYKDEPEIGYIPQFAELFAYYDGDPTAADTGNKSIDSLEGAIAEMKTYKKYKICE